MFLAAPCKGPLHVTLILTDTSLYCARQSLVPRMTVTDVWSGRVCAVGVCATIVQCIIAFIDIFVTVRSCPPRIKIATRRTSGNFVAYFTATVILAVLTPASGWTLWHTATTLYVRLLRFEIVFNIMPIGRTPAAASSTLEEWARTFSWGQQCSCFRITVFYGVRAGQQKVCEWGPKIWKI